MFYVVRKGRETGIYSTWDEAKKQVEGVKGAEYRKFKEEADAHIYLNGGNVQGKYVYAVRNDNKIFYSWEECKKHVEGMKGAEYRKFKSEHEANQWLAGKEVLDKGRDDFNPDIPTFYVDGSHKAGKISFGVVLVRGSSETTYRGQTDGGMANISGELSAFAFALHVMQELDLREVNVVYDYEGIEKWSKGIWKVSGDEPRKFKAFVDAFLLRNQVKIHYYKCNSHGGNALNNKADKVAKQALVEGKLYKKDTLYRERL